MTRELNRVTLAVLLAFGVITLATAFWAVVRAEYLRERDDNLRNVLSEQSVRRGAILDRDGVPLAYSEASEAGVTQRVYPYPAVAGAVGYYSYEYGTAGVEGAYDETLRGAGLRSRWEDFMDKTLHRATNGSDVRTTIDLDVQQAVADAMGDHGGAAVVVEVPSGRILAMVSQPQYDPNTLDADWDALTADRATSPLLNRVTSGLYQPGGALQTVMLAAILASYPDLRESGGYALNSDLADAHNPVMIQRALNGETTEVTLTCFDEVPDRPLTLAEAYIFGCPAPFAGAFNDQLTPERMWERYEAVGLLSPPALPGFDTVAATMPPLSSEAAPEALVSAAVGQGDLTLTPLHMLQVVAAVANQGNGVPLHVVEATRAPASEVWEPVDVPVQHPAMLRTDVAAALRLAMLQGAAQSSQVARARRGDLVLYGHSARSYGGPQATPYAWFLGFVDVTESSDTTAIAVVVVLEDESDPGVAADVAGAAFETVQVTPE